MGRLHTLRLREAMHKEFYGLTEEPFGLTPDPRFFFLTEDHKEIIDALIFTIAERDGLALLTGESGLGKTTLIQQMLRMLPSHIVAVPVFHPKKTFDELLEIILQQLNLLGQERNRDFMLSQFNDFLYQKSDRGEIITIIVDEAQELSGGVLEELRLLCNPDPRRPRLLKEVFVGTPQIEEKLNSPELRQLNQRITTRRHLRPLAEDESWHYIAHRLIKVKKDASEIFTPEAVFLICRNAKGIPQSINTICYSALFIGSLLKQTRIDSPLIQKIVSLLGGRKPGKWQRLRDSLRPSAARLEKSPLITKISLLLLTYSLLAWIIFFLLTLK